MNCDMITDSRLFDWLQGKASEKEVAEMEAHVAACPQCRARAEELRRLLPPLGRLASATQLEPATAMKESILGQAARLLQGPREAAPNKEKAEAMPRILRISHSAARYAVAAAILLALWWAVDVMRGTSPTENVAAASISDVVGRLNIARAAKNQGIEDRVVNVGDVISTGGEPASFLYNHVCRIQLQADSALAVGSDDGGGLNTLNLKRGQLRAEACKCNKEVRIVTCCGTVGCAGEGEFGLKVEPDGNVHLAVYKGNACVNCPRCGGTSQELRAGDAVRLSKGGSMCMDNKGANRGGCGCGR